MDILGSEACYKGIFGGNAKPKRQGLELVVIPSPSYWPARRKCLGGEGEAGTCAALAGQEDFLVI